MVEPTPPSDWDWYGYGNGCATEESEGAAGFVAVVVAAGSFSAFSKYGVDGAIEPPGGATEAVVDNGSWDAGKKCTKSSRGLIVEGFNAIGPQHTMVILESGTNSKDEYQPFKGAKSHYNCREKKWTKFVK